MAKTVTFEAAQARLAEVLDWATGSDEPVIITREDRPDVALIDAAELSSLRETVHLLSSPTNARRLFDAFDELDRGEGLTLTPAEFEAWSREQHAYIRARLASDDTEQAPDEVHAVGE